MTSRFTIAVVPQGSLHGHWKSVKVGTKKAESDLLEKGIAVDIVWKAPFREGDCEEQIKIVTELIRRGPQGMVLAPFDALTLVGQVESAALAGIPTVVIDSPLETAQIVSFIATDNRKGGALAADRMGRLLAGKGKVLLLRYQKGSASTEEREAGFKHHLLQNYPGIGLVVSEKYVGVTRDIANQVCTELLARYKQDEIQGVFAPNESSTAGMLMALHRANQAGKVALVGFDASDVYLDSMRGGQIQGLVVQNPVLMGKLAVESVIDHLQGKPVQKRIDTGATMVTPENIDTSEVQKLLSLLREG